MHLPPQLLQRLDTAATPRRLRWWQLSLRTLLVFMVVCAVLSLFARPLWAWGMEIWQWWLPATPPPNACGPCGMG
jgi:hypothetical protein